MSRPQSPFADPHLTRILAGEFYVPQIDKTMTLGQVMTNAYFDGNLGIVDVDERADAKGIAPGVEVYRHDSPEVPGVYTTAYLSKRGTDVVFAGVQLEADGEPTLRVMGDNKGGRLRLVQPGGNGVMHVRAPWVVFDRAATADRIALDASAIFQSTHHRTHPA